MDAPRRGTRPLVIAVAGGGVLALGVATYFAWDEHSLGDQRDKVLAACSIATPCSAATVNDFDRRGHLATGLEVAGYIAGGAALATSAFLYAVGRREHARSISVVPTSGGLFAAGSVAF